MKRLPSALLGYGQDETLGLHIPADLSRKLNLLLRESPLHKNPAKNYGQQLTKQSTYPLR
jgi:hypothetical protein